MSRRHAAAHAVRQGRRYTTGGHRNCDTHSFRSTSICQQHFMLCDCTYMRLLLRSPPLQREVNYWPQPVVCLSVICTYRIYINPT